MPRIGLEQSQLRGGGDVVVTRRDGVDVTMLENLVVREMAPSEQGSVKSLFKRCLGPVDFIAFSIVFADIVKSIEKQQGCCLIAVQGEAVVGTMSLRTFVYGQRKVGLIDAVASDKVARGKGVAKAILARAIDWFGQRGYQEVYATVDRYNSPSWNMFVHAGFSPYGFPDQVKDFGGRFLKLWFDEGYIFGFGTFFLKKGSTATVPRSRELHGAWHYLAACLGFALLWIITVSRNGSATPDACVAIVVVASLSVMLPELGHKAVARALGLQTCFKAWPSGFWFMLALGLAGGLYPAYGSSYIKQLDYSYTTNRREAGLVYVAGPVVNVLVAIACRMLTIPVATGAWHLALAMGFSMNTWLAIFNILPIKAAGGMPFDGYKVFNWSKVAWSVLAAGAVVVLIVGYMT